MVTTLCCHTVAVYRKEKGKVSRQVVERCFYRYWEERSETPEGVRAERKCLLIAPGVIDIDTGDRVYDGIGPVEVEWDGFVPAAVPGLSQIDWVRPWFVHGKLHHTEAGR